MNAWGLASIPGKVEVGSRDVVHAPIVSEMTECLERDVKPYCMQLFAITLNIDSD